MDNLNTHTVGSLYLVFSAEKARGLARRLEIHFTPKHGSWLNVAEHELSALTRVWIGESPISRPSTHSCRFGKTTAIIRLSR